MQRIKHVGFCAGAQFEGMDPRFLGGLAYCVDNNPEKWGSKCMGISVVPPEVLADESKSEIFISVYSSVHYNEVSAQLTSMGFSEGVHYYLENPGELWTRSTRIFMNAAVLTWSGLVEGDYYEFGVFKGESLIEAYKTISMTDRFCNSRYNAEVPSFPGIPRFRCFCFDSFQGLPKPEGIDVGDVFQEGYYKCDYDTFVENIASGGVDMDRVNIIKGWYRDLDYQVMEEYRMEKARIIHIDCDLYESARDALAFCTNLITDGTVIVFDDWFCFRGHPHRGEQQAFREWQAANPNFICTEYMREFPLRNSFIINMKS